MILEALSEGDSRLGFTKIAEKAFAFLLGMGFNLVRREATLLRFETENVFLTVYHGRSSYQIGVELGRAKHNDLYSLHEVLSAVAPLHLEHARYQAVETKTLEQGLLAIAEIIKIHCHSLLTGDPKAFDHLHAVVTPLRLAVTAQAQFGAIIDRADKAWEAKDLNQAQALYEKASSALDEMRARRLTYLRNRKIPPRS